MDEAFEALLEKIRQDRLPAYGSLRWDGQHRQVTETFRLQQPGESQAEAKSRLLRYLENLTPEERATVDIAIETKDATPYLLKVTGKTSELPPARLAELRRRAA
ncbi:MAG: hypothetical protein L6R45_29845 [Anaerolineae bacterium]|nr:hypothetical protein [Anaerolineae bacterium]